MADNTYAVACATRWQKPWWQGDPEAATWQGVMGGALDESLALAYQARATRFPTLPRDPEQPQYACPTDALGYLATERGLEMAPGETELRWRERLRDAWQAWHRGGTRAAHEVLFGWVGLRAPKVLRRLEFSTPPPVGSLYVRGFAQTVLSQFDVLVELPHPYARRVWGDPNTNWGDGGTWGSSMPTEVVEYLRRGLRQFKSGTSTCTYMHLSFVRGRVWGANKWGDGGVWGGSGEVVTIVVGEDHWKQRGLL